MADTLAEPMAPVKAVANDVTASCPDAARAPPAAATPSPTDGASSSNTSCAASEITQSASSHEMQSLVTATSSSSSDDSATDLATDDLAVQKEEQVDVSVPPVVHRPSVGVGSAQGVSRDADVKCSTGISAAVSSEESAMVGTKTTVSPGTSVAAPVSAAVHHPKSEGVVHTTAPETVVPTRTMPVDFTTTDVGEKGASTVTVSTADVEEKRASVATVSTTVNVNPDTQTKKRKYEEPVKNKTAYRHFSKCTRDYAKKSNPGMKGKELTKLVRSTWDSLTDQERNKWEETAAADKARYEKEMEDYKGAGDALKARQVDVSNDDDLTDTIAILDRLIAENEKQKQASTDSISVAKPSKKKAVKDPNAPVKNKTAFMHFSIYIRKEAKVSCPQMKGEELTKYVRSSWDNLAVQARNYWEEIAAADQVRYQWEWAQYTALQARRVEVSKDATSPEVKVAMQIHPAEEKKQASSDSIADAKSEDKDPSAPKTAFMLYSEYARDFMRKHRPLATDEEMDENVLRGWNTMNDQQRTYWEDRATEVDV